jgi:hypothetical protein
LLRIGGGVGSLMGSTHAHGCQHRGVGRPQPRDVIRQALTLPVRTADSEQVRGTGMKQAAIAGHIKAWR